MNRSRRVFSWIIAAVALPVLSSARAQADTISTLHMDINSITISAIGTNGLAAPFSTNFTGELQFSANITNPISTVDVDIDGDPVGTLENLTAFTGDLYLQNGVLTAIDPSGSDPLSAGNITVSDQVGNSYTYEIVADTGAVFRSPFAPVFNELGYSLAGVTYNGEFPDAPASDTFDGVDVTPWVNDEPLLGDFFQFHYRPNSNGVDTTGDVELYVVALTPSNGSTVPLPTSLLSGLAGIGMLGVYQWRRSHKNESK